MAKVLNERGVSRHTIQGEEKRRDLSQKSPKMKGETRVTLSLSLSLSRKPRPNPLGAEKKEK
jgi:hypothetical protein